MRTYGWLITLLTGSPTSRRFAVETIIALAINDLDFLDLALKHGTASNQKHGPHPPYYAEINKLFFATVSGSEYPIDEAVKLASRKSIPASDATIVKFLVAILTHDRELAIKSLEYDLISDRKTRFIDPACKLYNVGTHGLYEIALLLRPEIVEKWDVNQGMPWDAELYAWRRTGAKAISVFDGYPAEEVDFLRMSKPLAE